MVKYKINQNITIFSYPELTLNINKLEIDL